MTHYIPEGAPPVGIYIIVSDADAAMKWYAEHLGATETMRLSGPGGQGVMHAEMTLEESLFMLSDASPEWGTAPPGELSNFSLCVYVPDCDSVFERCVAGGATPLQPLEDQFWGDRAGKFRDPFGHVWMIMTHKEDVSPEEMQSRFDKMMSQAG